jgi:LysM repeat protein
VEESYRDHSDYLRSTSRYDFLFELEATDYKAWARGLKKAGYATSPSYADKLIEIIEEFGLQKYDRMAETDASRKKPQAAGENLNRRQILENNRVKYILAQGGDSYKSLTEELGKLNREIPGYNDAEPGDSLVPGQIVYIQPKRNKAGVGNEIHVLQPGETMAGISQKYAMKLSKLYELNRLDPGTEPANGTSLRLRKAIREPQTINLPASAPQGGEEEEEIKVDLNLD